MKNRNLKLFYLHELLFQFSDVVLILVLPIFIYKLFNSVSAVFIFIMSWNLIHGILFLPVFNLAMKLKQPKYFMMMGIVFYIISLVLFAMTTPENKTMIIPGLLAFSLYISFYWMIRHWFIGVNADYKVIGRQMSILFLIRTLIAFIAPIAAGAVSVIFSFNAAFILGVIAGTASLIPIAMFHAPPHPEIYTISKVKQALQKEEVKAVCPGYFWEGVNFVSVYYVWILIFAIFIGNILDLGLLIGFTTLLSGITIWLTGMWFDKRNRAKLLTRVSRMRTITVMAYASIFFMPHIAYVWVVEFINKLTATTHHTILDSYLYAYGNKVNPVDFMLSREIHQNISRFLTAGILAITFYFLPETYLWLAIFLGSFTVLGMTYAKRSDHHLNT
jgi:hypothetical protein